MHRRILSLLVSGAVVAQAGAATFIVSDSPRTLVNVQANGENVLDVPSTWEGDPIVAIGSGAFATCDGLIQINLPASITSIAPDAFRGCPSLESIVVDGASTAYSDVDGVLFDDTGTHLLNCPEGRGGEYVVPTGTTAIASEAFRGCVGLLSVILPPGVASIGEKAFADCLALSLVSVPNGAAFDTTALSLPGSCRVVRYTPGGLDDPALPPRWAAVFHANGGAGTMKEQVFGTGKAGALANCSFSRTGYTFAGWAKSATGPVAYKNRQSVKNLVSSGKRIHLYAVWTGVVYTVVYHSGFNPEKTKRQSFRYGTKKALQSNPFKRPGYVLIGWSKKPGGALFAKNGKTVLNLTSVAGKKVHLYALWAVRNYKVCFFANGGRGTMRDQSFVYGKTKALRSNAFTRKGYTFLGWAKKPTGSIVYANGQKVGNLTKTGKTIKLYARWRRNRYAVRFLANGGAGTMANQSFSWGVKKRLSQCRFTRNQCTFMGWATQADGKVIYQDKAAVKSLSGKDGATVTLYARWAKTNYSVHFNANGGTGSMADEPFVWGTAKKLRANAFSRKEYRFLGWSKKASATRPTYEDQASILNLTASGKAITLYAVWAKANDPNIVLCLGDSITMGYACAGLPYPARLANMSGRKVINCGVGGTTSGDGLATAEKNILDAHAATVCIQFGANDAIHHVDPGTTKENLRAIIRLCKKHDCRPIIATPTHQSGSHARFNDGVSRIATAVRALAREENVTLVDLNAAFGGWDGYLNPDDGLHLSDAGGDLMARKFLDAL